MATATPTPPVANPTWYGQIRDMFSTMSRAHMAAQGLDLGSYSQVVNHAGDIYQQVAAGNMPPGAPWPADWVATFLNWMNAGYPKGTPPAAGTASPFAARAKTLAAAAPTTRIRKDVTTLTPAELTLLKKAFTEIMARDMNAPNGYFVQAGYHWYPAPNTYCMHHVAGYNPWHRAYMLSFENALRSVPGCEEVTLPYWDITTPFPDVLKSAPFDAYTLPQTVGPGYEKGYVTNRYSYDVIAANLQKYEVSADVARALSKTDWQDFHGLFADAPNNTIIAAHDAGHDSIGPTMSDQSVAAFDPVFWFFHCNWDRLFWAWQQKMGATDLHGLMTTIDQSIDPVSYQLFTDPELGMLNPFTKGPLKLNAVAIIDSVQGLDVSYQSVPAAAAFSARTRRLLPASRAFSVDGSRVNVRVGGINRLQIPGSFAVHLQKDGKTIASRAFFQPSETQKCANCVANAIVHFDFDLPLSEVQGGKLSVWVEPANKDFVGDRFPHKLMGNPTIEVHLPLVTT
jgi:tyrosinase